MPAKRGTLLCRYHYDPLDRLANCTPSALASTQRFYLKNRLTSEIEGPVQRLIFQHDDQLLAQLKRKDKASETTLLACDQQRSVLQTLDAALRHPLVYTAYGYTSPGNRLLSLRGFNGERPDPVTGHYLLGNGYRAFNPVLMRFNSPDNLSPFGEGGLNAYAYCGGDPTNHSDPSGHAFGWSLVKNSLSKIIKTATPPPSKVINDFALPGLPSRAMRRASESSPPLKPDIETFEFIGFHGSTKENYRSLTRGPNPNFMDSVGGLSGGRGFYVAPKRPIAIDFSQVAASYSNGTPHVYTVHVRGFSAMTPGRHYQFRTMGEGGLALRSLSEMEIVLHEKIYNRIAIYMTDIRSKPTLPRASEAPF
ncbi:RHS repeat-associated core domain-containing protein [Pseudomonas sp. Z4-7]|uniref:RHS repeat-associated core domain-containing protein n=1 Tax=Pseudomonas sp. Z4-7 TaxID=2817413 RepID=UPI003DA839A8